MSTDPYGRPDPRGLPPTRAYTVAGPPAGPPLTPPPRRRSGAGWWLLGMPILLMLCCGAGALGFMISGDGTDPSSGPPAGQDASDEPVVDAAPRIGDPVHDGKFEFVVTQVETGVEQVGEGFLARTPQGRYVLVHLTVDNIGDKAQLFDGGSQRLVDTDGREHRPDMAAALFLADSGSFFNLINPGNVVEGIVVFDIPPDATPAAVRLHDSFLSGGVQVHLPTG